MVKPGDYLYNGKSFIRVIEIVKRKRSLIDVEIVASKVNFINQLGGTACITAKETKSYKNLGSNEDTIKNLYPDYYELKCESNLHIIQSARQFGKTWANAVAGGSLINIKPGSIIKNFLA